MVRQCSVGDAKNQLPSILHEVETGALVEITRHGRPVAVLVSVGEFNRLKTGKPDLAAAYAEWRARSVGLEDAAIEAWLADSRDPHPGPGVQW